MLDTSIFFNRLVLLFERNAPQKFEKAINGKIKCPLFGEEESLDREEKIKRKT